LLLVVLVEGVVLQVIALVLPAVEPVAVPRNDAKREDASQNCDLEGIGAGSGIWVTFSCLEIPSVVEILLSSKRRRWINDIPVAKGPSFGGYGMIAT
jgi:hypothetical protein